MYINEKIFHLTFAELHVYTIIYHRFMKNQEISQWPWKLSLFYEYTINTCTRINLFHIHCPFTTWKKMFCIFIAEFNKSPAVYNEFYVWFFYRGKIWYDIQGKNVVSSFEILRDLKTNCEWKVSPGNMENSSRTFFYW